jgi:hypothetical protein
MEAAAGVVERAAWAASSSSRRFFFVVTLVLATSILLASGIATGVAVRNAAAVADARDRGLRVASSVTEFRNHLSLADAEVATTLVSGELASPLGRARYEAELLQASLSLTDAGLVATGRNTDDIETLATRLARYAGLVETSRHYPVGSTFYDLARTVVRTELVPIAARVRRTAEQEVKRSADRVTGPFTTIAVAGLVLAPLVLIGSATLVAGRTHIRFHVLLVVAGVALVVQLGAVGTSLWSQRGEMQSAADGEIEAYVDANAAAFTLFRLRSYETDAVASQGTGEVSYDRFQDGARSLVDQLGPDREGAALSTMRRAVEAYVDSVDDLERLHGDQGRSAAVETTLEGDSAIAYRTARGLATSAVNRSTADLTERLGSAADAGVAWLLPVGLGIGAAALATAAVLQRGWDYLTGTSG